MSKIHVDTVKQKLNLLPLQGASPIKIPTEFFSKCLAVEQICDNKLKKAPTQVLSEIETKFPDFFKNFKKFSKSPELKEKMINFRGILTQALENSNENFEKKTNEKSERTSSQKKKKKKKSSQSILNSVNLKLLLDSPKTSQRKDSLSFKDDISNQGLNDDDDMLESKKQVALLKIELTKLKKRNHYIFDKVEFLEKEMLSLKMDRKIHVRKTYEIQDEVKFQIKKIKKNSLLDLPPQIDKSLESKTYFWAMYRRLRFFATVIDLFRSKLIRVRSPFQVI